MHANWFDAWVCVSQAWFPNNFANISSSFQALSALDYYIFLLNQLPTVAFSSSQLPAFIASDVRVSCSWASLHDSCTHQHVPRTPVAASASFDLQVTLPAKA